jgi:hypothetical protein
VRPPFDAELGALDRPPSGAVAHKDGKVNGTELRMIDRQLRAVEINRSGWVRRHPPHPEIAIHRHPNSDRPHRFAGDDAFAAIDVDGFARIGEPVHAL